MFEKLEFKQFQELAKGYERIAVFQEFSSDLITPMTAVQALKKDTNIILLESGEVITRDGRFSHIGFEPIAEIASYGFETQVRKGDQTQIEEGDPFEILRRMHRDYVCGSYKDLLGFAGGAAGYFAYDAVRYIEDIPDAHLETREYPDVFFQFFDRGITFDHEKKKVLIVRVVERGDDHQKSYKRAMDEIEDLYATITSIQPKMRPKRDIQFNLNEKVKITPDDQAFREIIHKAKDYIRAGDAFQIVPSRRFEVEIESTPFEIYRSMRYFTPSPFMFYISHPEFAITGASPEKLVSVRGRELETIPLAGTRPKGKTPAENAALAEELLNDPKEIAEHMMLVDLGRNDLGMVSKPGTVKVTKLKEVQFFSHVMHIASFIQGELREELDALDALKATLPAGTLSGAPKIRAMEIIDELEPVRRGPYGGAICFLDHLGNLGSCIGIRMALIKNGKAVVQTGMGIVMDSDPEKELEESVHKARGVLTAIQAAEEGVL